jgi:hypothetical protein
VFTKAKPAIKPANKGKLHKALGIPEGQTISVGAIHAAMRSKNPHMRKMANFANNARKWGK